MRYDLQISEMTWSYSRITSFEKCRYGWLLKYIYHVETSSSFYAEYGTFMHHILELFYRGKLKQEDMRSYYIASFVKSVTSKPQSSKVYVDYFVQGLEYLKGFTPVPGKVLGIESKQHFEVNGSEFVGYIDLVLENDQRLLVVDNKSRALKHRSARKVRSNETLDEYLKQLYLYSIPLKDRFGRYPDYLCFNCFRSGVFIKEPFLKTAFEQTVQWATDRINEITCNDNWHPTIDWFVCKHLCDVNQSCEYYDAKGR